MKSYDFNEIVNYFFLDNQKVTVELQHVSHVANHVTNPVTNPVTNSVSNPVSNNVANNESDNESDNMSDNMSDTVSDNVSDKEEGNYFEHFYKNHIKGEDDSKVKSTDAYNKFIEQFGDKYEEAPSKKELKSFLCEKLGEPSKNSWSNVSLV